MKMENTTENKRIFFAQYYGQDVLWRDLSTAKNDGKKIGIVSGNNITLLSINYLLLKPLNVISDEDVIELTKIIYKENYVFDYDVFHLSWERITKKLVLQTPNLLNVECYQYLQSKGYALPFRNLSVKELEFYGWIRLEKVI